MRRDAPLAERDRALHGNGLPERRAAEGARGAREARVEKLLTLQEVAEHLRLSTRTVRRLVASGRMPCARLAGRLRFVPADVGRFVEARKG